MKYQLESVGHKFCHIAAWVLITVLSVNSSADDLEAGRTLFATYCQSCHGANGDGNGPAAAQFILKPRDFALAAFKFDTDADWQRGTDTDLANVIKEGAAVYGGSALMPMWSQLTDGEVDDLITYIRSLKKE